MVTLKNGATAKGAITIPANGLHIWSGAFRDATQITSVDLNNVTKIGGSAFNGATNLTSVTMNKVTEIGPVAFANCPALKTIIVKTATPPTVTRSTFIGITGATVYVPKGAKAAYDDHSLWKKIGTIKELE